MSLLKDGLGMGATAAFLLAKDKLRKKAVEKAKPLLPFLENLADGRCVLTEDFLQERIDGSTQKRPELESLSLKCCDGHFKIEAICVKMGAKYAVTADVTVDRLVLNREEQVAVLSFPETLGLEGKNWAGVLSAAIASNLVDGMLKSDDLGRKVLKQTGGLVEVLWPQATVFLDRLPQVQRINDFEWLNVCAWDLIAITGCSVHPGAVIIHLVQP